MAKLGFTVNDLASRVFRTNILGNNITRIVGTGKGTTIWSVLGGSVQFVGSMLGWALESIVTPFLAVSASTIFSWILGGTIGLVNFNFAITDDAIEEAKKSLRDAVVSQTGSSFGTTVGWVICGYLPGLALLRFNESLAYYILKEVNEEGLDEISDAAKTLTTSVFNSQTIIAFLDLFVASRALIRNAANGQSNTLAGGIFQKLFEKFPSLEKAARQWGNKPGENWTISQFIEDKIQSIPNEDLRNLVENFVEEAVEACIEAGYVVAHAIDSWRMQQRIQKNTVLGDKHTVEIYPDRSIDEPYKEPIILNGHQNLLKPVITQTLANHQQMRNLNVGVIVGESIMSYAKKMQSEFQVRLFWSDRPDGSKRGKVWTYCTLNNFDKAKLNNWKQIKALMGGKNGRIFGNVTVKGLCNDGSKIVIKASSENEGQALIRDLVTLTGNTIQWETKNEKLKEGTLATRYDDQWIDPITKVYPAQMVIFNKYRIENLISPAQFDPINNQVIKKLDSKGEYIFREVTIPLWMDNEPFNYDLLIKEITTIPGSNPT